MAQVRHRDKITDQTEEQWLSEHVFEHNGFHIDTPGSYIQAEPTSPIKKFKSTQEIAEKIKQFIDSQKFIMTKP